jgi:hypothetical protein
LAFVYLELKLEGVSLFGNPDVVLSTIKALKFESLIENLILFYAESLELSFTLFFRLIWEQFLTFYNQVIFQYLATQLSDW